MLSIPKRKPDPIKYILWTDSIHSTDPSCYLHGSFNFTSYSDIITSKQHVALTHWEYVLTVCNTLSFFSPFYLLSLMCKYLLRSVKDKLEPNYTSIRNYIQNIVELVINYDVI